MENSVSDIQLSSSGNKSLSSWNLTNSGSDHSNQFPLTHSQLASSDNSNYVKQESDFEESGLC